MGKSKASGRSISINSDNIPANHKNKEGPMKMAVKALAFLVI
jgi:hypothetical protein